MAATLAHMLVEAHRAQTPLVYRADLDPGDAGRAYAIQAQVAEGLGAKVAGWKCGAMDAGRLVFGAPILDLYTRESGGTWRLPKGQSLKIEVEIAIRLGRDLPVRNTRYTRAEILDATAEVFCGVELVGARFANAGDASFAAKLADNFNNAGYVVGGGAKNFAALDLSALRSKLWIDGKLAHDAVGGHGHGDPLVPVVAWASQHCDALGGLRAGQFVTTGTLNKPPTVDRPAHIEIEVEGLGRAAFDIAQ
jgi:2-keto-4-pentenoate hydratase